MATSQDGRSDEFLGADSTDTYAFSIGLDIYDGLGGDWGPALFVCVIPLATGVPVVYSYEPNTLSANEYKLNADLDEIEFFLDEIELNDKIIIRATTPVSRNTDYTSASFYASVVNKDLDRLKDIIAENSRDLQRCVRLNHSVYDSFVGTMPHDLTASSLLGVDATGAALELTLASTMTNPAEVTTVEAEAGTETAVRLWAPEQVKEAILALAPSAMTGAEIKTAYEAESDTNAFTDANVSTLGNQSGTNTGDQNDHGTLDGLADDDHTQYLRVDGARLPSATFALRKGSDVASATTLPLIDDGNTFDVTGTTTITAFAHVRTGAYITLHFDAILILENSLDLLLPGGNDITTAVGDIGVFVEHALGDYRCVSWQSNDRVTEAITIALSDETTDVVAGVAAVTYRMPYAFTITDVRSSLSTAGVTGLTTVDINEGGTTILSTKLTIDSTEKTSTTAATAVVVSDSAIADDAELTFDIDLVATGTAPKGLKVTLIGYRTA